jgi:hypothetical protein
MVDTNRPDARNSGITATIKVVLPLPDEPTIPRAFKP